VRQTESPERANHHLGLPIARGILNHEPHFLEGDVPMLVLAENLPIGLLQRAEQAPFAAGLVIVTYPIVMAIPHGSVSKKRIGPPENAETSAVAGWSRDSIAICCRAQMPTTAAVRSASVQTIERRFMALSA
jgi:hypothetical protein